MIIISSHRKIGLPVIFTLLVMFSYPKIIQGFQTYPELRYSSTNESVIQSEDEFGKTLKLAAAGKAVQSPSGLTTQLSSEKDVYMLGEPVTLSLRIQNRTSAPVVIYGTIDVRFGFVSLEVAAKGGGYRQYRGGGIETSDGYFGPSSMEPGKKFSTSFTVLFNVASTDPDELPGCYIFSKPGRYFLRVRLSNIIPDEIIYTESIRVKVVAPKGTDAAVWKLLQTKDAAYFLHTGRPRSYNDISILKEFEQIIARYPNSAYAPYMQRSLNIFRTGMKKRKGLLRQADVRLVNIKERTFMLRTRPGNIRSGKSDIMKETDAIMKLADLWLQAYNANDIPRMFQHISREVVVRQKWERASDRVRKGLVRRFTKYFSERGTASLSIVRFTHEEDTVTADVTVTFEHKETNPFKKMKFVKDDDGIWRVHTGF